MALINSVEPAQADGQVVEIYAQMQQNIGFIPQAFQLYSINPAMLEEHWKYIGYHIQHPSLSGKLMTMIRLLVSVDLQCEYCININSHILTNDLGMSKEQIEAMIKDPEQAPLDDKEKALLLYVIRTTADSNASTKTDIDMLRQKGCSDLEIFDALHHGARQVAADILFNAFKIENDF
jgi:uncharacterized peroxidase-related enzyme